MHIFYHGIYRHHHFSPLWGREHRGIILQVQGGRASQC
jgi:hypothetical protein